MIEQIPGQMSIFDLDIWSGKTCQEPLVQTKEKISEPCLKKQPKSRMKLPLFLDLRGGRWTPAGCIMGNGWSIAWRVHDAQFWGVPQRRKRIALVADFGGYTAPEILFERKSLFGNIEESGEEREEAAKPVGEDSEETISFQERAGCDGGVKESLSNTSEQEPCQRSITSQFCNSSGEDIAGTLDSNYYKGCGERQGVEREVVYCLQGNGIDRADTAGCNGRGWRQDQSYTLNTIDRPAVCVQQAIGEYKIGGGGIQSETARLQGCNGFGDTVGALCADDAKQAGNQYVDQGKLIIQHSGPSDTEN